MPSSISRIIDCLLAWKCRARLRSDCCRNGCQCDVVEGDTQLTPQNSNEIITPHGVSKIDKNSLV
jgi:hypothetical protein